MVQYDKVYLLLMALSGIGVIGSVILNIYDMKNKNVLNAVIEANDGYFSTSSSEDEGDFKDI
jgi:hypothetical protein